MKTNTRSFMLTVAFILLSYFSFVDVTPKSQITQTYNVELVQLYSGTSSGKNSHLEFIAVYQGDNIRFDETISASFYSMAKIGQRYDLERRPMDVDNQYRSGFWLLAGIAWLTSKTAALLFGILALVFGIGPKRWLENMYD